MSAALADFQAGFVEALHGRPAPSLGGLAGHAAFAVYRNTVTKGWVEALEANFPSAARLVGRDAFRALAVAHAMRHPPTDGRLLVYGAEFAADLAARGDADAGFDALDPDHDREPAAADADAASAPVAVAASHRDLDRRLAHRLAGVAALDRFWTEAHVAADAPAACGADLAAWPAEALGALRLRPHPSARWRWFEGAAVYSLWRGLREGVAVAPVPAAQGEGALIVRRDDSVGWHAAGRADCAFLDACAAGASLGEAATLALAADPAADPAVDVAGLLARLLRAGALALPAASEDDPE